MKVKINRPLINLFGSVFLILLQWLLLSCNGKTAGNSKKEASGSLDSLRKEFYGNFNSIYRNTGGDIWIFPVNGSYRMANPSSSEEDAQILKKYKQFIEIRGWNSEQEEIELTADNINEVLDYCVRKALRTTESIQ